ncbi:MAG: heme biosynthesis protein HemY [Gammaproteobacteria bacterium]|nr:heme biosynthesis protein HemY [Gammaproteobacteria bacterium]
MRRLFVSLTLLLVVVSLALFAQFDSGYVLLSWGKWVLETSFSLYAILSLLLFSLFHYSLLLWRGVVRLPKGVGQWRVKRLDRKALDFEQRGQMAYAEGRWKEAEKLFSKSARLSENPLVDYLSAARAAQKLWRYEERDHYLALAHQALPEANMAVGLTQAELQLVHGQLEQALASLNRLRQVQPGHAYILLLLVQVYTQLEAWGDLVTLLPELRKRKVLENEAYAQLEQQVFSKQLELAISSGLSRRLQTFWSELPKSQREKELFIVPYSRALVETSLLEEAETLLRSSLKRRWTPSLMHVYGMVRAAKPEKSLAFAEGFLKQHEHDAVLLLSLGRLCLHNRLWGKARAYLEASLSQSARGETYRELGTLLDQLGEDEAARDCYRKGMNLLLDRLECTSFTLTPEECESCKVPEPLRPALGKLAQSPAISKASE